MQKRAFVALLLLALAFEAAYARPRSHSRHRDRAWKQRKRECEQGPCSHLVIDEAANCVNECVSPACYAEIYAAEPLEDGEIDVERRGRFQKCVRDEQRTLKRRGAADPGPA